MRYVKCNKCGYVGPEGEFPKDWDFLQQPFVAKCPKCDNWQTPGGASMRMFGGERPFEFVRKPKPENADALATVIHRANEAS